MPAPDLFGIKDYVRLLTAPAGMEAVHVDGMSWAKNGLTYPESTKLTAEEWNIIIGNLRGLLMGSGLDINTMDPESPLLLRDVVSAYVAVKIVSEFPDLFVANKEAFATELAAIPAFVSAMVAAVPLNALLKDQNFADVANKIAAADNLSTIGASIASAATTDLSAATGRHVTITGAVPISSFGVEQGGAKRTLTFAGAPTLTHNAVSLILPGGADIVAAAGDVAEIVSLGAGNWRVVNFSRANGKAVVTEVTLNGAETLANKVLATPTLTLKQSANPTPTAEGDTQWDTDDNVLVIGDGAAQKVFVAIPASTAAGDTEYFASAKAKARIAKGTAGQKYQMNAGATAPEWADGVAGGTNIATTSGTAIDVTSIPAYAKKITINFGGVSTNGTSLMIVQLGDSGGIETSGYLGTTSGITNAVISNQHSTGFIVHTAADAAATIHGTVELSREDVTSNTWAASITTSLSNTAYTSVGGGSKALSATLDRVRITTVGGTNTFDAGSLNVTYEA
jgi:hypothetical protein